MTATTEGIAPPAPPGPMKWLRDNLFSTWYNSLLTIVGGVVVYFVLVNVVAWVFTKADWRPITVAPLLYLVGQYPREELWRAGLSLLVFAFLLADMLAGS